MHTPLLKITHSIQTSLTVLTCQGKGKKATKEFSIAENGNIEKRSFSAGTFFTHEEIHVSCLQDLAAILDNLLDAPKKFIIKGKPKESAGGIVRRKIHEPQAAFDMVARPYVMLDIDKHDYPSYFDATVSPEEVVRWVREMLPLPFKKTSCYYKFSASQNVPKRLEEKPPHKASIHLWFWCDRSVSDYEWKQFFKINPAPIDKAIFSPVQIHYTARPIFKGMDDPLPVRSGILKGDFDDVSIPAIPASLVEVYHKISKVEPNVTPEDRNEALNLLFPYYKEGSRNRFCGAIAGMLYCGGWIAENIADFVYELADTAGDSEAMARYNSAIHICEAIDFDRPAQGIPTLRDELGIDNIDKVLTLLGVGKPDINSCVSKLLGVSDLDKIREVIKMLVPLTQAEQKAYIDRIQKVTNLSKTALNASLKELEKESNTPPPADWSDRVMERMLEERFGGGRYLLRASDGRYWVYNEQYWEPVPIEFIKKEMLPYARGVVSEIEGQRGASSLISCALNILEGRVYRDNDPLHVLQSVVPKVINCQNGELWFDEAGEVILKPHLAESYLQHCLSVEYDPAATAPMFEKAVLEIFADSSNSADMFRHFMEFMGYICQPWRKLAIIVLLYGGGNNGKTSLVKVLIRILGERMVMSDRINEFEKSEFKIGALDGKLMLLDEDVEDGTCLPDGFLKKISEEKTMTGQHKYKDPFEFTCRAVPVMLANSYPAIKDLTEGIRRRVMVIPFVRKFESHEVKNDLFDDIWKKEDSGILNHVVAGFQRLKQRGKFLEPEDCIQAKKEWLIISNMLTTFIEETCDKGNNLHQFLKDIYAAYKEYCVGAGVRIIQDRRGFERRLISLGYRITKLNGDKVVRGLRSRGLFTARTEALDINLREGE